MSDDFNREFKVKRHAASYVVSPEMFTSTWIAEPLTRRQKARLWVKFAWRRFTTYFERLGYALIGRDGPWTECGDED